MTGGHTAPKPPPPELPWPWWLARGVRDAVARSHLPDWLPPNALGVRLPAATWRTTTLYAEQSARAMRLYTSRSNGGQIGILKAPGRTYASGLERRWRWCRTSVFPSRLSKTNIRSGDVRCVRRGGGEHALRLLECSLCRNVSPPSRLSYQAGKTRTLTGGFESGPASWR